VDCSKCLYLRLEQEALREEFKRGSGESGYELNQAFMPPRGTEVIVIFKMK
jgi:hypothetical protein